jgi:hypothetical protein
MQQTAKILKKDTGAEDPEAAAANEIKSLME